MFHKPLDFFLAARSITAATILHLKSRIRIIDVVVVPVITRSIIKDRMPFIRNEPIRDSNTYSSILRTDSFLALVNHSSDESLLSSFSHLFSSTLV